MHLAPAADQPAPRTRGDLLAMRRAYDTGHVFAGALALPTIDHRQYMERELDMHNVHQSFAVRQRLLNRQGHSDNLVVWFTDTVPGQPKASQTLEALAVMDQWMLTILGNPAAGVARQQAGGGDRQLLRPQRPVAGQRQRRLGRHPRQPAGRCLHAGLPAVRHLAHRGRRADRGQHLPLRAQAGAAGAARRHLRQLDAERRAGGAAGAASSPTVSATTAAPTWPSRSVCADRLPTCPRRRPRVWAYLASRASMLPTSVGCSWPEAWRSFRLFSSTS